MTLKQTGLLPTSCNDIRTVLGGFELVAGGRLQLGEIVRAEVRQCMTLEPSPQIFDRIQIGRVRRQESNLGVAIDAVQVIPYQFRPVRLEAIPDNQERLLEVGFERLEKLDDLFLLDAAFVKAKQTGKPGKPGNDRQVLPVEVELDDWRLPLGAPSTHPRRTLAQTRLVDKDDYAAFPFGFFLSAGQVLCLNCSTAASSRSMARRSGFWLLKPSAPIMRQTCTS